MFCLLLWILYCEWILFSCSGKAVGLWEEVIYMSCRACYACFLPVCLTRVLSPWAPPRQRSPPSQPHLASKSYTWLKPLSYFQFSSAGVVAAAQSQLVWLTTQCFLCVSGGAPGEVLGAARCSRLHLWSPRTFIKCPEVVDPPVRPVPGQVWQTCPGEKIIFCCICCTPCTAHCPFSIIVVLCVFVVGPHPSCVCGKNWQPIRCCQDPVQKQSWSTTGDSDRQLNWMTTLIAYFVNSLLATSTEVFLWTESCLHHCCPDNIFTTRGTKMTLSMKVLFRDFRRHVVVSDSVLALRPVQGRNGGATYQCYFSLCLLLIHTCAHIVHTVLLENMKIKTPCLKSFKCPPQLVPVKSVFFVFCRC